MKNSIKFLFLILVNSVFSQAITDTGTNVGIGTTAPDSESRLHVESPNGISDFTILATSVGVNNWSGLFKDVSNNFNIQARDGTGMLTANLASFGNSWLNGGNVGIGTTNPYTGLHLWDNVSNATAGGTDKSIIRLTNAYSSAFHSGGEIQFGLNNISGSEVLSTIKGTYSAWNNGNLGGSLEFYTRHSDGLGLKRRMYINSIGNVGIGTIDTKGFKLGVQGKIAAEEVKVAMYNNWADFVFENNYILPTLKEVEQHINEKGHLKDIPSAEEVKENGIFLGEMDSKLLQKIEELTLYTINQEKSIEKLISCNNEQQKEIETLKKENNELKLFAERLIEIEKLLAIKKR